MNRAATTGVTTRQPDMIFEKVLVALGNNQRGRSKHEDAENGEDKDEQSQ
jgi:hypothetical protein